MYINQIALSKHVNVDNLDNNFIIFHSFSSQPKDPQAFSLLCFSKVKGVFWGKIGFAV